MLLHGFQPTTLLDYPGKLACTVFTGNCNFRCTYCHNASLVLHPEEQPLIPEETVFSTIARRQGILQGICITGGEPALQPDLPDFICRLKETGLAVKLDTNGYCPEVVKELVKRGLLDYVAMDIKTDARRYPALTQIRDLDFERIRETALFLMEEHVDYEFRTTVVAEYYDEEAAERIGKALAGSRRMFLQAFRDSDSVMCPGLHGRSHEQMESYVKILSRTIREAAIRGES